MYNLFGRLIRPLIVVVLDDLLFVGLLGKLEVKLSDSLLNLIQAMDSL